MYVSAGMMNMDMHVISSESLEKDSDDKFEASIIYNSLRLDDFAGRVHYNPNYVEAALIEDELFVLWQKMDVYMVCNRSVFCSKDGKLQIWGDVYLTSDSKIKMMVVTEI